MKNKASLLTLNITGVQTDPETHRCRRYLDWNSLHIFFCFTSPSDRYCTGRASTNCFTLLHLKHLWQWNQSFRGQNCFELICIFSGTMNRGIGSDSSLHHNAWSLELKTKDNSSLPRRSRLWDMDFNKVGFNLLVFKGHYLENWVCVFNSFMKLCETEQQGSVTSGHFLRAFRIYSEANASLSF